MKKAPWIIAAIIIIVLVIIGGYILLNNQESQTNGPIKIGGAFGITGFASVWGVAERNAAIMAIDEINENGGINGRQVELIIEDTATDNAKTVSAVSKLINIDKVILILGPSWLDSAGGGALSFSENNDIVMITSSAGITAIQNKKLYKNVFSTWFRSDKEVIQLANYVLGDGKKNTAILMQVDPYWDDLSSRIREVIESRNQGVKDIHFAPGENDFRTYFLNLKRQGVDAIFFGFNSDKELLSLLKQRKQIYPNVPMYTTEYIEEFVTKAEYTGLMDNIFYISPKTTESEVAKKYKKKFNEDAVFSAMNSYDATMMVLEAMKVGNLDSKGIRDYLKNNEFNTVTFGKTRFDDIGGITTGEYIIKKIENNQAREI